VRHLKCDEGKPACNRCKTDRFVCDGYRNDPVPKPEKEALRVIQFQPNARVKAQAPRKGRLLQLGPLIEPFLRSDDMRLFHYVRDWLVDGPDIQGFWHQLALPRAHTSVPIRYALYALGRAHRYFTSQAQNDRYIDGKSERTKLKLEAIQQYNHAIAQMNVLAAESGSQSTLQTTLICCVIFICIENLHGRYTDAIRHLHAGCHLLMSPQLQRPHWPEVSEDARRVFDSITELLCQFGRSIGIYLGNVVSVATEIASPAGDLADIDVAFTSFDEARQSLNTADKAYNDFLFAPDPSEWPHSGHYHLRWGCSLPEDFHLEDGRCTAMASISALKTWAARFELFRSQAMSQDLKAQDRRRMAWLSLRQSFWLGLFELRGGITTGFGKDHAAAILQNVEILIQDVNEDTHPVFAFEGDIVPSLALVCFLCQDTAIQNTAASMLCAMNRREGIWDSREVAVTYSRLIATRESRVVDVGDFAGGVPQLLKSLAAPNAPAFERGLQWNE
jgi:hypothetical protein